LKNLNFSPLAKKERWTVRLNSKWPVKLTLEGRKKGEET